MNSEDFIFRPNTNNNNTDNFDTVVEDSDEFYTILGNHEFLDKNGNPRVTTDTDSMAKKILLENGNYKFAIKINRDNRIFNPLGMYSEGRQKRFLNTIGKDEFVFRKVNMDIFDNYVNFLRTRNDAWLKNAERSLI